MKIFNIELTGKTPILMHHDNIEWADFMSEWQTNPENKKSSKAGDDRTPAWRWLGCVYHDGKHVALPQANIMRCMMEGGAMVLTGKGQKTFKAQTQSGMMTVEPFWQFLVNGKQISWADIEALKDENTFANHKKAVDSMGFGLMVKRARIGQSKHIRVRPVFNEWTARGSFAVWDEQLETALPSIMEYAGQYKGLGDWRPGGKTPGPYGTFEARVY